MSDTTTTVDLDAIVIGTGFGGIYMLHKLRNELGLTVRAFEKGGGVGGTRYFNRYPGAKSDTEGFVYRYSFDKDLLQEWDWTTRYLEQPAIEEYLNHVVDRFDLRRDIQLDTEVTGAAFDERRNVWQVRTSTDEEFTSRYLVTALGLLAKTNIPAIPGIDSFAGTLTHTNAWPAELDITGQRVGVIGTGSTGTQFIVAAAKTAAHLTVFQRSPQYVVPSGNGPVEQAEVAETVTDPETARKLTPTEVYAKRPLCNEAYFETFNRDDVTLVSIKENPIAEITPAGVRTADGVLHELDVLVLATGFDAVDGNYRSMDLRGRDGKHIDEYWSDGPTSYLGLSTNGFPNMFMILGPNGPFTNLPPSIETQVEWISDLIGNAERNGVAAVEPTRRAEDEWTELCETISNMTLFPKVESWIYGQNIAGKKSTVMFYMAGIGAYRQKLAEVEDAGYEGFAMHRETEPAGV